MKLLIPNDLLYVLLRNNIKNINSFVSRGLFTLMLATCIRHIWVYSILITLSGDIETKPGPKPSSCDKFSICHCNPNSIFVHDLIKISLLRGYISTHNFDILYLSESYLDSSISSNDIENIRKVIDQFPWAMRLTNIYVNEKVNLSNKNIIRNYIPHKKISCDNRDPPRINKNIKELIHEKNQGYKLYRQNKNNVLSIHPFKLLRSKLNSPIGKSKSNYYTRLS